MDKKLEITVEKTIEALARIERFIEKYGEKLDGQSIARISKKIKELETSINNLE